MKFRPILDRVLELLSFVKAIKEALLICSDGNINKAASFWKLLFSSGVLLMAYSPNLLTNYQIRKVNAIEERISGDIDRILYQCGFNSFATWIRIDDKEVYIEELRGCINHEKECVRRHLEYDNPEAYSDIPPLDLNTYDWLYEIKEGQIPTTKDLETWRKYDTAYQILSKTNLPLDEVGFTVIKDFKNDIIYVFTLYFAKNSTKNCQYPWLMLQEFGLKVKSYL